MRWFLVVDFASTVFVLLDLAVGWIIRLDHWAGAQFLEFKSWRRIDSIPGMDISIEFLARSQFLGDDFVCGWRFPCQTSSWSMHSSKNLSKSVSKDIPSNSIRCSGTEVWLSFGLRAFSCCTLSFSLKPSALFLSRLSSACSHPSSRDSLPLNKFTSNLLIRSALASNLAFPSSRSSLRWLSSTMLCTLSSPSPSVLINPINELSARPDDRIATMGNEFGSSRFLRLCTPLSRKPAFIAAVRMCWAWWREAVKM